MGRAITLLLIFNGLVLAMTDLQMGRSFLLLSAMLVNLLYLGLIRSSAFSKFMLPGFLLVLYLATRQLLIFSSDAFNVDSLAPIIFVVYSIIFVVIASSFNVFDYILIIRFFLYLNVLFGLPDYFGFDLNFLHVERNEIQRFRGLATEPNLLAIPLMIFYIGLHKSDLMYRFKNFDLILLIVVIYFTYSKAAYLFLLIFWIYTYLLHNISLFRRGIYFCIIILIVVSLDSIGWSNMLYKIPFYNNFISLIDLNKIYNYGLNEFIISLSFLDQLQGGSFGTRLATGVATLHTIVSDPLITLFGVGGGQSYIYVLDYIFRNGLENFEINYHLATNPKFITDKTYVLNFLSDYGLLGFSLLIIFLNKILNHKQKVTKFFGVPQKTLYAILLMFFTQSQFILIYLFLATALEQKKHLNTYL